MYTYSNAQIVTMANFLALLVSEIPARGATTGRFAIWDEQTPQNIWSLPAVAPVGRKRGWALPV